MITAYRNIDIDHYCIPFGIIFTYSPLLYSNGAGSRVALYTQAVAWLLQAHGLQGKANI